MPYGYPDRHHWRDNCEDFGWRERPHHGERFWGHEMAMPGAPPFGMAIAQWALYRQRVWDFRFRFVRAALSAPFMFERRAWRAFEHEPWRHERWPDHDRDRCDDDRCERRDCCHKHDCEERSHCCHDHPRDKHCGNGWHDKDRHTDDRIDRQVTPN